MLEDKLSAEERIRLEALNQAVASLMSAHGTSGTIIVSRAREFEKYIKGDN